MVLTHRHCSTVSLISLRYMNIRHMCALQMCEEDVSYKISASQLNAYSCRRISEERLHFCQRMRVPRHSRFKSLAERGHLKHRCDCLSRGTYNGDSYYVEVGLRVRLHGGMLASS